MRQGDGKHLVRPAGRILLQRLAVDDVVQAAIGLVPEARVERCIEARGMFSKTERTFGLRRPLVHETEGIVEERVDFDGLAAAGRDDPIVDLGIHPRELIALGALAEQTVCRIDANAEVRAAEMVVDDVFQRRQQSGQQVAIARDLDVAVDGVEEP
jgi:hypothetical protein